MSTCSASEAWSETYWKSICQHQRRNDFHQIDWVVNIIFCTIVYILCFKDLDSIQKRPKCKNQIQNSFRREKMGGFWRFTRPQTVSKQTQQIWFFRSEFWDFRRFRWFSLIRTWILVSIAFKKDQNAKTKSKTLSGAKKWEGSDGLHARKRSLNRPSKSDFFRSPGLHL